MPQRAPTIRAKVYHSFTGNTIDTNNTYTRGVSNYDKFGDIVCEAHAKAGIALEAMLRIFAVPIRNPKATPKEVQYTLAEGIPPLISFGNSNRVTFRIAEILKRKFQQGLPYFFKLRFYFVVEFFNAGKLIYKITDNERPFYVISSNFRAKKQKLSYEQVESYLLPSDDSSSGVPSPLPSDDSSSGVPSPTSENYEDIPLDDVDLVPMSPLFHEQMLSTGELDQLPPPSPIFPGQHADPIFDEDFSALLANSSLPAGDFLVPSSPVPCSPASPFSSPYSPSFSPSSYPSSPGSPFSTTSTPPTSPPCLPYAFSYTQ